MAKSKGLNKEEMLMIALLVFGISLAPIAWVIKSHFESSTYNKLTGANTTTWEAMWVELRVQSSPNK